MIRILFLDVDGVLNGHDWHEGARSNTLRKDCIEQLSRILKETGCRIVLSSAWRYLIHCGAMNHLGFEAMLRSHGASGIVGKIVGVTRKDEHCCHCGHRHRNGRSMLWDPNGYAVCKKCRKPSTRGDQISAWSYGEALVPTCPSEGERSVIVALDDDDFGITAAGIPLVKTNGACGLTKKDADRVIKILGKDKPDGKK
ncbi:MAG: hypothetical protein KGL39_26900 [Patescibacteria group bacterium]|nr:hypothetical protein [Patescibacteria group bacterium]